MIVEFRQALDRRRMVRRFSEQPVSHEVLDRVARAALSGPTAGNTGSISVILVTDPDVRARIAAAAGESDYVERGFDPWISSAPGLVVVCVSEDSYRRRYSEPDKGGSQVEWAVPYWWVDGGAALMLVLLAAVDEGLAAGFLGSHSIPDLSEVLDLPAEVLPLGVITVGHPESDRRSGSLGRRHSDHQSAVHYDRWGSIGV